GQAWDCVKRAYSPSTKYDSSRPAAFHDRVDVPSAANRPYRHSAFLDLVADAVVANPVFPQPRQGAPKALSIPGRFCHQTALDRTHDDRTGQVWRAPSEIGRAHV